MKRIIITAAAALVFIGCAKQEMAVSENMSEKAIDFSSYVGRDVTKASNLNGGSFTVSAYKSTENYFKNVVFTWDGTSSKFKSSQTYYWPSSGTLDFYAVMPSSLNITDSKTVDFSSTGIDGKTDFCAAKLTGASYDATSGTTLAFSHKLTKVAFKFTGKDISSNDKLKYVISSVTLTAQNKNVYDLSLGTPAWGTNLGTTTYTVNSDATTAFTATLQEGSVTSDASYALMLLPAQSSTVGTVVLSVNYKVYENEQLIDDNSTTAITTDLSSYANSWAAGNSIVYNVTLGLSSSASPITFTATLTDWDTEQSLNIPIPVTSIELSDASVSVSVGGNTTLTATVSPANATNKTVTWSSSNTSVATVDASTGVVAGVAEGTATITATAADGSGVTGSCTVTVTVPVTSITVTPSSVTVAPDGYTTLTATVLPDNATNKTVTWSTSDDTKL